METATTFKAEIITGDAVQVTNVLIQYVQDLTATEGSVGYEFTEDRIQALDLVKEYPVLPGDEDEDDDIDNG